MLVKHYLKPDHELLDMDTGGGEFLLSLKHPYEKTSATEAYVLDGTFWSPPTALFRIPQIKNSSRIASQMQISATVSSCYRIRSMTDCWLPPR